MEDDTNLIEQEHDSLEIDCLQVFRRGNSLYLKTSEQFRDMNMSEQMSVINGTVEVLLKNFDSGAMATLNVEDNTVSARMHNSFDTLSLSTQQRYFTEASILFRKMSEALGQQKLMTTETLQ